MSILCIRIGRYATQQTQCLCLPVVVVAGSVLLPASQFLSKVSPGSFLVAVGVPYLALGNLLVEMYLDSVWPRPFCVVCCPGDTRPSSICSFCNMATVR